MSADVKSATNTAETGSALLDTSSSVAQTIEDSHFNTTDDAPQLKYIEYGGEHHLPLLQELIEADLSEPYSVYTYRYFLNNWPALSTLVSSYLLGAGTQNLIHNVHVCVFVAAVCCCPWTFSLIKTPAPLSLCLSLLNSLSLSLSLELS
jgi:hypothetical protein